MRVYNSGDVVLVEFDQTQLTGHECVMTSRERFAMVLKAVPKPRIVINLDTVDHLSSAMLSELLHLRAGVKEGGGQLRLAGACHAVRDIFRTTNLEHRFKFHQDARAAIASFAP